MGESRIALRLRYYVNTFGCFWMVAFQTIETLTTARMKAD